jgi:hypothetical protein
MEKLKSKSLKFWRDSSSPIPKIEINLGYIDNYRPLRVHLSGDIQSSISSVEEELEQVKKIQKKVDENYEMFGNVCTISMSNNGVILHHEYKDEISGPITLSDMEVILLKWQEFIKTQFLVEYVW